MVSAIIVGTAFGISYALLFCVQKRGALLLSEKYGASNKALISLVLSPMLRLGLLALTLSYLLLKTTVNPILVMIVFMVSFWIVILNHERFM